MASELERRNKIAEEVTALSNFPFRCLSCDYSGLWAWHKSRLQCPSCGVYLTEFRGGKWVDNGERIIPVLTESDKGLVDMWPLVVAAFCGLFIIGLIYGWIYK